MTRIETIFGGLLAAGILAVFAFVFFGSAEPRSLTPGSADTPRAVRTLSASSLSASSLSGLMSDNPDDYVAPSTACECYYMGYDMIRERIDVEGFLFEGQLQTCYDNVGASGATAMQKGASDAVAEPRARRSCRTADYL